MTVTCPRPYEVAVRYERYPVPCGKRSCEVCGALWLGDARQVVAAALRQRESAVCVVTVTAPGQDVLPFGPDGRTCREPELSRWNDSAPGRWSAWWRACSAEPRAWARRHGVSWGLLAKVWEAQKRGALHLHVVLPFGSPVEREATYRLLRNLDGSRWTFNFGYVDRGRMQAQENGQRVRAVQPVEPGRAAGYVAKYMTGEGKGEQGIGALARAETVRGPLLFTAQRLTRRSGVTMRSLRARRRVYPTLRNTGCTVGGWEAARVVDSVAQGRPPLDGASALLLALTAAAQRWGSVVDVETGEYFEPTPAPLPWDLRVENGPEEGPRSVGRIRLDYVWHDVFASHPLGPVRTHISIVDPRSGDDVRRSARERDG